MRREVVVRAGLDLVCIHEQLRNCVGVVVPQPKICLQPGHDLRVFCQPFLGSQGAKVVGCLARFCFDIVEICLERYRFPPYR